MITPTTALKADVSNAVFTITAATPVLTSPNGKEIWYSGVSNYIYWNSASIYTSGVKLEYSLDGGASWITIASNATNSGSYNWLIPNVSSANALVRIRNYY